MIVLTNVGRAVFPVDGTIPWVGRLGCVKWRRRTEHHAFARSQLPGCEETWPAAPSSCCLPSLVLGPECSPQNGSVMDNVLNHSPDSTQAGLWLDKQKDCWWIKISIPRKLVKRVSVCQEEPLLPLSASTARLPPTIGR